MHGMHTVYFIKDLGDLLWMLVSVSWQLDVLVQPTGSAGPRQPAPAPPWSTAQLPPHPCSGWCVLTAGPCARTTAVILAGAVWVTYLPEAQRTRHSQGVREGVGAGGLWEKPHREPGIAAGREGILMWPL